MCRSGFSGQRKLVYRLRYAMSNCVSCVVACDTQVEIQERLPIESLDRAAMAAAPAIAAFAELLNTLERKQLV